MSKQWKDPLVWFRGLLAAFIGGGAGAVAAGFICVVQTPKEYNFDQGLNKLLVMIFGTFLVSGIVSAAAYLQRSPLPELEEVTSTVTVKSTTTIEQKTTP